jgi:hypothetical protein
MDYVTAGTEEGEEWAQSTAMQQISRSSNMPSSLLARTFLFVAVHGGFFCGVLLLLVIGRP